MSPFQTPAPASGTVGAPPGQQPHEAAPDAGPWWRPRRADLLALAVWAGSRLVMLAISLGALARDITGDWLAFGGRLGRGGGGTRPGGGFGARPGGAAQGGHRGMPPGGTGRHTGFGPGTGGTGGAATTHGQHTFSGGFSGQGLGGVGPLGPWPFRLDILVVVAGVAFAVWAAFRRRWLTALPLAVSGAMMIGISWLFLTGSWAG